MKNKISHFFNSNTFIFLVSILLGLVCHLVATLSNDFVKNNVGELRMDLKKNVKVKT